MKIAEGIGMLQIKMNSMGRESIIYPTVIWDDDSALLIDAGLPNSMSDMKLEVENEGVPFEMIETLIITHQDIDHFGGAHEIVEKFPDIKVYAHKEDVPYIQGEKRLVRLNSNFMDRISNLSEEQREKVLDMFENNPVKIDNVLTGGEEFGCFGGIKVIHTPGHTPGHICIYHEKSKTLIAGDAMNLIDGKLVGPNLEILTEDEAKTAIKSLEKLMNLDIENVICYHGGLLKEDANQAIKDFMETMND